MLSRNNSICPSPEKELLEAVKRGDTRLIRALVASNRDLLTHEYPYPDEKPILGIVCSSLDTTYAKSGETVQALIDSRAELTVQHLHWAAANPNLEVLQVVIKNLPSRLLSGKINGNTVLHHLIKSDNVKCSEDQFVPHLELLLKSGVNVNEGDGKELSAIYWAAKYKLAKFVSTILEKSIEHVDLDTHRTRDGKTARLLIKEHNLYPLARLPEITRVVTDSLELLFRYVKLSREADFIESLKQRPELRDEDDGSATLLQYACEKGLIDGTKVLLDLNADVTKTTANKPHLPIEIVAERGYFEIFKALLDRHLQLTVDIPSGVLCTLLQEQDSDKYGHVNHEKCTGLLLDRLKYVPHFDVNHEDDSTNTPLHYALRYGDQDTRKKLLQLGASLGASNKFGTMPIMDIKPKLLEEHLNSCITFDLNNKNYEKRDFEVTFNYVNLLLPAPKTGFSPSSLEKQKLRDDDDPPTVAQQESQVIAYMSKDPELKHLLKHPIIVSFLFLKWHRIRWIFYINLLLYLIFTTSLIMYIFTFYGINYEAAGDQDMPANTGICAILILTFILLILRELFQMAVTGWKYYKNFENIIELCLLVLTGWILFADSNYDTRKQLSSIVILLAAFELVLMLGQHPKLSTNVVMLKTVSINFFKLLLWYSLLIIAFALSFNILFTAPIVKSATNKTDDEEGLFTGPGSSLFKTIVMLTGEFDAGSINFHTYPVTSKAIFIIFVFVITIILLNLLNGLAVSDIHNIKNDAEMVGHVARAQHIQYVESMLLGNILPTKLLRISNTLFCCFPWSKSSSDYNLFAKPLANRVCLATSEMNRECKIVFFPNNKGKVKCKHDKDQIDDCHHCVAYCSDKYLDRDTVNRINAIVKERKESQEDKEYRKSDWVMGGVDLQKVYLEQLKLKEQVDLLLRILTDNKSSQN